MVPLVVLSELDAGKSGTDARAKAAREATRYLDMSLQGGERGIRVQQRSEVDDNIDPPYELDEPTRRILSCCRYFGAKAGAVTLATDDALLTGLVRRIADTTPTSHSIRLSTVR